MEETSTLPNGKPLFGESDWNPAEHPAVASVSMGMWGFRAVPIMEKPLPTEFVSVEVKGTWREPLDVLVALWNSTWQSGGAQGDWRTCGLAEEEEVEFPPTLRRVLQRCEGRVCVRFLPTGDAAIQLNSYGALYQLLPLAKLRAFKLPVMGRWVWPPRPYPDHDLERAHIPPSTLQMRLQRALANHLWPLLSRQSGLDAFSAADPIRLLAFNLDFWLPHIDHIVEERMRFFGKAKYRKPSDRAVARELQRQLPPGIVVEPPLYHAEAWKGEDEAWQATREMVELADQQGKLRALIDAVRSHRVEDDFSAKWSRTKEDFERKLYSKRSKCRVSFVEINDSIPVHGPDKEVDGNLIWDDLMAMVDPKDRRVVVCLRNGVSRVSEISDLLGYANHSAVSKKLARIRERARKLLA